MNQIVVKSIKLLCTWLAIFFAIYMALEMLFMPFGSYIFPYASLGKAGPMYALLGQHSKRSVYPENYIAILGDSYAYGQGDWMIESELKIRPDYSAAHVIHEKTKIDVVSFGKPASDSITSNNIMPLAYLNYANSFKLKKIDNPEYIIVYFYEGNDINDNVEVIHNLIQPMVSNHEDIYREEYMQEKILPALIDSNEYVVASNHHHFSERLLFYTFAKSTVLEVFNWFKNNEQKAPWKPSKRGEVTKVRINSRIESLPDFIQTPALILTKKQIDDGAYIFDQSLARLIHQFPEAKIGVAYLPAVITPYEVVSDYVHDYYRGDSLDNPRLQKSEMIRSNSDYICERIRNSAIKRGVAFIDTRAPMRAVAGEHFVHGPIDWNHFNQLGYEILSASLIKLLENMDTPDAHISPCQWQ